MTEWTVERVDRALSLWADGRSASEIASTLGGVSRNAVIGKINRLQIAGKAAPRKEPGLRPVRPVREPPPVAPAPSRIRRAFPLRPPAEADLAQQGDGGAPPDIPAVSGSPSFRSVKLHELEANECHWPVTSGHGPALFCGCTTARLESFCTYHARLAYQPRQAARGGR